MTDVDRLLELIAWTRGTLIHVRRLRCDRRRKRALCCVTAALDARTNPKLSKVLERREEARCQTPNSRLPA